MLTISLDLPTCSFAQPVVVNATPAAGYVFSHWIGGVTDTESPSTQEPTTNLFSDKALFM